MATNFIERYTIEPRYLTAPSKRRSGAKVSPAVRFIVAHDTGNPNSTASGNVTYYERTRDVESVSAHIFVDDKQIIECIPALTASPEKAWHVLYNMDADNRMYGHNANDAAIAVEYCYGTRIDADEAYRKYVWVIAKLCYRFSLDPVTAIVGHAFLDPQRKTDPVTGLSHSRRSYEQLLRDIPAEYSACSRDDPATAAAGMNNNFTARAGTVVAATRLNIRVGAPSRLASVARTVSVGNRLDYVGWVDDGEPVNLNPKWYRDSAGNYFWSGATL